MNTDDHRRRVLRALAADQPLAGGYLFWNLTAACPNRCGACGQHQLYASSQRGPDRAAFERVARDAFADGLRELFFSGGEPSLLAELPEHAAIARDIGLATALFTSGAGGREAAARVLAARPDRVTLSLDAADASTHDRMRGRVGAFDEALEALELLLARGAVQVDLHAVLTRTNLAGAAALVELARERGVRHLAMSLVLDVFGLSRAALRPSRDELLGWLCETLPELVERAGDELTLRLLPVPLAQVALLQEPLRLAAALPQRRADPELAEELAEWADGRYNARFRERYGCLLPLRDVVIAPTGDVYPCSSATAFQARHVVGNVFGQPLGEIRRGAPLRRFLAAIPENDCCARCHACSNMSDGSYLVRRQPEAVPARVWASLAGA